MANINVGAARFMVSDIAGVRPSKNPKDASALKPRQVFFNIADQVICVGTSGGDFAEVAFSKIYNIDDIPGLREIADNAADAATKRQVPDLGISASDEDSGPTATAILQQLRNVGGGRPRVPSGIFDASQIILRYGVGIEGQGNSPGGPFPSNTVFKATGDQASFIVAPNQDPLHSVALRDFTIEAHALGDGGAAIRAGFLESIFENLKLVGKDGVNTGSPTTVGFDHLPTFPASWINKRRDLTINGFGFGIRTGGSDSSDSGHHITGNSIGYLITGTTGSIRLTDCMIDLSNLGFAAESPPLLYFGEGVPAYMNAIVASIIYHFNLQHVYLKFVAGNGHTSIQCAHVHSNCIYNFSSSTSQSSFGIDSHLTGGHITGCTFAQNIGPYEISLGGVDNGGWMFNASFDSPVNKRFLNLPSDAHVLTGGPGGQYNYLTHLTINNPGNAGAVPKDNRFSVYANDTVLGQSNVIARLGLGRNSGADAAILFGVANGNGPFIKPSDGEQTQSAGLAIYGATGPGIVIDRDGNLRPYADGGRNCGTPTAKWANVYVQSGALNGSDQKLKTAPQQIPEAVLAAAAEIEIVWFQYLSAVAEKGEEQARKHVGVIAQQVLAALAKHGIDEEEAFRWGFLGRDPEYRREVTTRTVEHPVFETIEQVGTRVVIRDGVAVQETFTENVQIRAQDTFLLFDESGRQIIETVPMRSEDGSVIFQLDEEGNPVYQTDEEGNVILSDGKPVPRPKTENRQAVYTTDRVRIETIEDVEMVPTGGTTLSVRYDQLALLMIAALRRK